ncbi:MAG: glycoside hydrolase family 71/99-like protein [Planctomycetota bacterium]|nr:glycoside hydrolase family 71/99-like protein [Planctomycetota bacterium]
MISKAESKILLVHYMPWFASRSVSGHWGWHWTMDRYDPDKTEKGKPQIASHFHPLMGAYDSQDRHTLECHVQLMKLAGIDGVIIDWYGVSSFRDYGEIHRNTKLLVDVIQKAKMKFAICYEDQTLKHRVAAKQIAQNDLFSESKKDLDWLENNWFKSPAYVKNQGKPVLLVFGPQRLEKEHWSRLQSNLSSKPVLLGLPHLSQAAGFEGTFGWPPVHGGKQIVEQKWKKYVLDLYARQQKEVVVSIAFSGFQDYYRQAGVGDSYGQIAFNQGKTFQVTLDLALRSRSKIVQIATWNDFGEGTNIEPAWEYGYQYLETLQARTGMSKRFGVADLKLPIALYHLRKRTLENSSQQADLDQMSNELLQGKVASIHQRISRLNFEINQSQKKLQKAIN